MSIRIMTQVWATDLPNAGNKIVLLALADNANDEGACYPSVTTLARKCSMDTRTVQRNLRDLEAMGLVSSQGRAGRSTVYTLDIAEAQNDDSAVSRVNKSKNASRLPTSNPRQIATPSTPTPGNLPPLPPANCHHTPGNLPPITVIEPSCEPKEEKNTVADAPPTPAGKQKKAKASGKKITFSACVDAAKRAGKNIIPEDDAIYRWAEDASIPDEWLALAWDEFCSRYRHNPKTYVDWPAVYRNAVRGNWFKLWRSSPAGLMLTTEGETARRVRAAAEKRRASGGPVSAHA